MAIVRRAVPAAAGYPQYSGNLTHPIVSMELIERFYQTSIFADISSTEYIGELVKGGDSITFWREPTVVIRDYVKGEPIISDTIDSEPHTMVIDRAKVFSAIIDKIDINQMQNWERYKGAYLKNASRAMANMIDADILGSIYADVHVANQGASSGVVSGAYNLGSPGAPIPVTNTNVVDVFTNAHGVLNEAAIPRDNRWIVIPSVMETVLLNSDLKAAYLTGLSESTLLTGKLPSKISNFNVYISDHVPRVFDTVTNSFCYNIIAGTNQGLCFAAQLESTREIEDANDFLTRMQGLTVYGYDVVQPTALTNSYVRIA